MNLLTVNSDPKTTKNKNYGYLTGIVYLAPNTVAGHGNVCPSASPGCIKSCLYTAGRSRMFPVIQQARIRRTELFFKHRKVFMQMLRGEIAKLEHNATIMNLKPAVRLNGTSDVLPTEYIKLMQDNPDILFYDYTKVYNRLSKNLPDNYSLTFSRSEQNDAECIQALINGHNVAVVFDKLPEYWHGFRVINGDEYDARFLDDQGVVVGLKAKGSAKKDTSGFVITAVTSVIPKNVTSFKNKLTNCNKIVNLANNNQPIT
jgi:hypothetical protein